MVTSVAATHNGHRSSPRDHKPVTGALVSVRVRLGQLHLHEVQSVLTHVSGHLLDGDGALADGVEGLRVVLVLEVRRVVVGLGPTIVLKKVQNNARKIKTKLREKDQRIIFTLRTQQTPNPLAQEPSEVPPISLHSLAVKQVPLSPELLAHSVFSNWTQVIRFRN